VKQLVVLSGKGGTGKTTITAAFAHLASENPSTRAVVIDAGVDAANLELLLEPQHLETQSFVGGQTAVISADLCTDCGLCANVCRFHAIGHNSGRYVVDAMACEGCAACMTQCPSRALSMIPRVSGRWFYSLSRYGPLFHTRLSPAEESSGKLIALLKQQAQTYAAENHLPLILVDGPPGIGCPAIASVSGADVALVVTEPTASGIHDMERALDLAAHFGVPAQVCINKADLYPAGAGTIAEYCRQRAVPIIGRLPFDASVTEALVRGKTITAYCPDGGISQALRAIWQDILVHLYAIEAA